MIYVACDGNKGGREPTVYNVNDKRLGGAPSGKRERDTKSSSIIVMTSVVKIDTVVLTIQHLIPIVVFQVHPPSQHTEKGPMSPRVSPPPSSSLEQTESQSREGRCP
jgi:hypothetical protein